MPVPSLRRECGGFGGCTQANTKNETVLTFSGAALGAEGTLVAKQLMQFMVLHPNIRVELQRTPDDASQRHQLYAQWLFDATSGVRIG